MKKSLFFSFLFLFMFVSGNKVFAEDEMDWARESINLQEAFDAGLTGKGVKIAIIDSGFLKEHEDLKDINYAEGISCTDFERQDDGTYKCVADPETHWWDDQDGHGTNIISLIAAQKNDKGIVGTAPEATIYPIKVKNKNDAYLGSIIAGIYWAIDHKVDIINISQAYGEKDEDLEKAVNNAAEKGILIVAGAGNETNKDPSEITVKYPAAYENTLAVGGYFQNRLRCSDILPTCKSSTGPQIDIAAPLNPKVADTGNGMFDLQGYENGTAGTSNSSPMVAGVAALYLEQMRKEFGENYTAAQLKQLLVENASYKEGYEKLDENFEYGSGFVNARPLHYKNPYFKLWLEESKRKSNIKDADNDDEIIKSTPRPWYSQYTNHVFGYSMDFPSYWFVDHSEPSKYVRFFFNNLEVKLTFEPIKDELGRKEFINQTVSKLPNATLGTPVSDYQGNAINSYHFAGVSSTYDDLDRYTYYFLNTYNGVFIFKVKTTDKKENLKEGISIGEEMRIVLKSFTNFDSPKEQDTTSQTFQELYKKRVIDPKFNIPFGKTMFGLYDSEGNDTIEENMTEWETELNNPPMGTQTIKGYLNYYNIGDGEKPIIENIVDKGRTPIIDLVLGRKYLGYDLFPIVAGSFDERIKDWANELKSLNKPVFVRLGSAMNGSMKNYNALKSPVSDYEYEFDTDLYVSAYRRVVDLMKEEGATNVKFVWSPSVQSYPKSSLNDMSLFYPGDDYVDWINMMGYNEGTDTKTFNEIFDNTYKQLRRMHPDKPMMIETSSSNKSTNKEAFIHSIFDHVSDYPNIQMVTWYNGNNDYWIEDYGKSEFNITLPRTTNDYVSSMLKNTDKITSTIMIDCTGCKLTLDDTKQTYAMLPSSAELSKSTTTVSSGTYAYTKQFGDWYYIKVSDEDFRWVNPKLLYTTYNKNIFIISKVVSLYKERNDTTPYSALSSQGVFATDKWVNKETGQIWYKINTTFAGPLWLCVFPSQVAESSTFPITLTQTTPIYNNPNDTSAANQVSTLGIQTVNGISRSGGWAAIQTWLGNKWMNVSGSYAMVGTVTTINKWIPIANGTYMHNFPYDATKLSTALGAQNVLAKAMWVDPDSLNNGKFTTWYKINTYLGDKWIKQ